MGILILVFPKSIMKLIDLASSISPVTKQQIMQDSELVRDIQARLGITSDGIWGGRTEYAVADFCANQHLNNASTGVFGATFAKTLLEYEKNDLITAAQATAIFGRKPTPDQMRDLNRCLVRFEINTPPRIQMFIAQICHESGNLKWMKELASGSAYEGRRDLGNTKAGWGKLYRGAGVIQLTGRSNYEAFAKFVDDPKVIELGCDYVSRVFPFTSAGFFWMRNHLNDVIDQGGDIYRVTRIVNGGLNGISDRISHYNRVCRIIK